MKKWNDIILENMNESSLNGLNLPKARKAIEKVVYANIGGLYRDDYWNGPKKIWDALTKANIDFTVMGNRYRKDKSDPMGPDKSKEWDVEFHFVDDKGNQKVIHGLLTAHGAGSVKDPLDAYDMTMSVY